MFRGEPPAKKGKSWINSIPPKEKEEIRDRLVERFKAARDAIEASSSDEEATNTVTTTPAPVLPSGGTAAVAPQTPNDNNEPSTPSAHPPSSSYRRGCWQ